MSKKMNKYFVVLCIIAVLSANFSVVSFADIETSKIDTKKIHTTEKKISANDNLIIETSRVANKTSVTFSNYSSVPINYTVAKNPRFIPNNISVSVAPGRNATVTVPFTMNAKAARPHKLYISLYNPSGGKIKGLITYNDYV